MKLHTFATALFVLLYPTVSLSQELTPRAYWPAPNGTKVLSLGLVLTDGDTVPDPSLPIVGLDSDITTAYVAYRQTVDIAGRTSNLIVELPYSDGTTTAENDDLSFLEASYQGTGDLSVALSINFLGAPTMDNAGFAQLRSEPPRHILGGSIKVVAPTGSYDSDKLLNVGANRWAMRAELGYMLTLHNKWILEADAGVWVFGDNDNLRGKTREQDEIFAAQLHLVHRFGPGFWGSLDYNAYKGGRSTYDGRRLEDLQRDSKVGATLVFPFAKKQAVKFGYTVGSLNDSNENFDVYSMSYQRIL